MHKRKRGNINWNRVLQWVLIALIIGIVLSWVNIWAFWWLPFLFFCCGGCRWAACSIHEDKHKDKNDDIEYV